MFDISYYTNIINSVEVQAMIDEYESVFILVSLSFFIIGIILVINQKILVRESKRRVGDFMADVNYDKNRRFLNKWDDVQKLIRKEEYRKAIKKSNDLTFKILKRFGYMGNDLESLIKNNEINDKALPNIDNIKEMISLEKDTNYIIGREKSLKILDIYKDTLIKINILDK